MVGRFINCAKVKVPAAKRDNRRTNIALTKFHSVDNFQVKKKFERYPLNLFVHS
jgi:hypothetical protein